MLEPSLVQNEMVALQRHFRVSLPLKTLRPYNVKNTKINLVNDRTNAITY